MTLQDAHGAPAGKVLVQSNLLENASTCFRRVESLAVGILNQ